jgi:hypothetical protein
MRNMGKTGMGMKRKRRTAKVWTEEESWNEQDGGQGEDAI